MPLPAYKSLDEVVEWLNNYQKTNKKLGDIDKFTIKKELESCLKSNPTNAFIGLGILATIDKDEMEMRKYFSRAMEKRENIACVYYNFGLCLLHFSRYEEAADAFKKVLRDGTQAAIYIDNIALNALLLGDNELLLEVLQIANKLQCNGENILTAAFHVALANCDSQDEAIDLLDNYLPDSLIQKESVLIEDEKWDQLVNLSDEIKKYI